MRKKYIGIICSSPEIYNFDAEEMKKSFLAGKCTEETDDTFIVEVMASSHEDATAMARGAFFDADFCRDGTISNVFPAED